MQWEDAQKLDRGEMPAEWYSVAKDKDDLISIIAGLGSGFAIHGDLQFGSSFGFVVDGDSVVFFSDEFKDANEEEENHDFHVSRFQSIAAGVAGFKVNGRPISEIGLGCRIAQYDMPPVWALTGAA